MAALSFRLHILSGVLPRLKYSLSNLSICYIFFLASRSLSLASFSPKLFGAVGKVYGVPISTYFSVFSPTSSKNFFTFVYFRSVVEKFAER